MAERDPGGLVQSPLVSERAAVDPGSQARSRATFDRIVSAAEDMLDGRDWDSITVEDVCLAAEVSPSSFYRRFRSKDALLDEIHRRWVDNRLNASEFLIETVPWDELSVEDILMSIARMYIGDRAANHARSLSMFRVQVSYPRLATARLAMDRTNLELVSAKLADRLDRDVEDVCFALLLCSSSLMGAVQPPAPWQELLQWDDDRLARRMAIVFAQTLDLDVEL